LTESESIAERSPRARRAEVIELGRGRSALLLVSVFVIASCGLAYELMAGTLSAYLLGNSAMQFSMVIGLFLTAMGIGSFLSRYVERNLIRTFLYAEVAVGVIGGLSPLLLFFCFAMGTNYTLVLIVVCLMVGTLVGLEIPLLVRILRDRYSLESALGNVLSVDYLGALVASLVFPLVLLPRLGLVRSGCMFGMLNVAVALLGAHVFRHELRRAAGVRLASAIALVGLALGFVTAGKTTSVLEDMLFDDPIIYAETTPYQRIVLTQWRGDVRMFINGNIQFSSVDEFRYHEALVHPAMGSVASPRRVLILGGGDGMAAREVLRHPGIEHIDLVDLDPAVTRLFRTNPKLIELNHGSLNDSRVSIHNRDAFAYLAESADRYDVIIIDLPDPNNESLGKLYTTTFYRLVAKHLSPVGVMVTQATSPFYARHAFWCIHNTIAASRIASEGPALRPLPYRASVPSFGEWGFVMASLRPLKPEAIELRTPTRYLSAELLPTLFVFPKDIGPRKTEINRLSTQPLVRLYRVDYLELND
jgi:spermidine synthase